MLELTRRHQLGGDLGSADGRRSVRRGGPGRSSVQKSCRGLGVCQSLTGVCGASHPERRFGCEAQTQSCSSLIGPEPQHSSPSPGSPGGSNVRLEFDQSPKFAEYAHPERLVSTEWLKCAPRRARVSSSSNPTKMFCCTKPVTFRAPSRSTGTPTSTTRSLATSSTGRALRRAARVEGHQPATPPWSSTATRATGGPRTRSGCSRSSATRTCACSTADATSGSRKAAS